MQPTKISSSLISAYNYNFSNVLILCVRPSDLLFFHRSQKFTQRKLAFVSKFDLADEEPIPQKKRKEKETDPHRLEQRQKQIDYGKNTVGYEIYNLKVPRFVKCICLFEVLLHIFHLKLFLPLEN